MAIDIKKLLKGEYVPCDKCEKGQFIPRYNTTPDKASQFTCKECGNLLILQKKMK